MNFFLCRTLSYRIEMRTQGVYSNRRAPVAITAASHRQFPLNSAEIVFIHQYYACF